MSEISSRHTASNVGRIMKGSFFFPSLPSSGTVGVLLVSSLSHLHSLSRLLLLGSRDRESISKAQGLELVQWLWKHHNYGRAHVRNTS